MTAVKIVLASVVTGLALYQVVLMAVGYGKVRLPFLEPKAASSSHRAVGDTAAAITALVAVMCIAYFGFEDGTRVSAHIAFASLLLGVLALKILVLRRWHALGRYLPVLGLLVLTLFVLTWITSAGAYLIGG